MMSVAVKRARGFSLKVDLGRFKRFCRTQFVPHLVSLLKRPSNGHKPPENIIQFEPHLILLRKRSSTLDAPRRHELTASRRSSFLFAALCERAPIPEFKSARALVGAKPGATRRGWNPTRLEAAPRGGDGLRTGTAAQRKHRGDPGVRICGSLPVRP